MGHNLEDNNALGGLNFDDEIRNVPVGDYLYAKNIRNAINSANKGGSLTNVLGNLAIDKYTLPYSNGGFPTGTNKCIGAVEDLKNSTVIFFVWNSNNNHQILRYYRNLTDPINPYGEVQQIVQYNFGWTKGQRITGANIVYGTTEAVEDSEETGDLLYWCDPVPHKINLTKGNVCVKQKTWDVYLPQSISYFPEFLFIGSYDFSGALVAGINITMPLPPNPPTPQIITVSALVGFQAPNQVFMDLIIPNLVAGDTFTISGAATPSNDQTYTVVSVVTTGTGMQITVTGIVTFGIPVTTAVTYQYTPPAEEDTRTRDLFISTITDAINADANSLVTAESCDCSLSLTEKTAGTVWSITANTSQVLIPPKNWYGGTLIDRFFDRCKWQPLNAPSGTYFQDENVKPNYVQRKVFQFRLEYGYDDLERSALGVWSQIPINNLQCDGTTNIRYNYIDVNFNDTLIPNAQTLVLLKRIRFIARAGNPLYNELGKITGNKDKAVISLEPCDFLDWDGTNWFCHFKFYNDIISDPIDDATASKLFDIVPLEVNAEQFKENRMIEAGILEGYNAPDCPKADFTVQIQESRNKQRHKVTGKVRILTYGLAKERQSSGAIDGFSNFFPTDAKYPFWKPPYDPFMNASYSGAQLLRGGIFHDVGNQDYPFFGGGSFTGSATSTFGITTGMETDYDQRIPAGGFTAYAAGTPNYTTSKQININRATDTLGALDTSSQIKIDAIGQYLFTTNEVAFDLYSTFELELPDGVYVIRLASHWCSEGDVLEKGFVYDLKNGLLYQKTSTNVHAVIDDSGTWLTQKELTVTVNGGDVYIGEFIVMDVAPPIGADLDSWQAICGYLYDDNGLTDPNSPDYAGIPVEKTLVFYGDGYLWQSNGGGIFGAGTEIGYRYRDCSTTDANGYFFGIGGTHNQPDSPPVEVAGSNNIQITAVQSHGKIRTVDTVLCTGTLTDLLNKTLQIINFNGNNVSYGTGTVFCIVTTNVSSSRLSSGTVEGYVKDQNGFGASQVSVVYQNGRFTTTNQDGFYRFIAWADEVTLNAGNFNGGGTVLTGGGRTADDIIFNGLIFCEITYPSGQLLNFSLAINENINTLPDFIISEIADAITRKTRKRGGKYIDAIRYYDSAGRPCSVVKLFDIYIPFETEDLSTYSYVVDNSGNPYPAGTYRGGIPIIGWTLDANYAPPQFAAYYQFMRTKNLIYGRYLQWVTNAVTYLSRVATSSTPEIVTSFNNGDAVAIKISISNITAYYAANNDSQIGYTYQAGDRVRLIYDRDSSLVQGLVDLEVTSFEAETQSLICKIGTYTSEIFSGQLIEIFNPKSIETEDEQIFYEVGEVYKCTAPGSELNEHEILTGVFTNGDTYWTGRNILVNDTLSNFSESLSIIAESASVSDFFPSEYQDIGRIGIIDPSFKQISRPMLMRCSNQFIPSTAINGLSSFEALNQKELDRANGSIQRLISINNTVVAVSTVRETSNYIQVVTLQQAGAGQGVLAVANQYFGTEYPHSKTLGTDLPATVLVHDGRGFGWTNQRGDVWKYLGDGESVISSMKMVNYFNQLSSDGVSDAHAAYDRFRKEYIITLSRKYITRSTISSIVPVLDSGYSVGIFYATGSSLPELNSDVEFQYYSNGQWNTLDGYVNSIETVTGGSVVYILISTRVVLTTGMQVSITYSLPETVAWFDKEQNEKWASFSDCTPECWCAIGNEMMAFKDGRIWIQDKNTLYNNFFGVQYESKITPVFNEQPMLNKVWNALWMIMFQEDGLCNWRADTVYNTNGQLSRLQAAGWRKKEQDWYVDFKRDLTDVSVTNPILNGRRLRSSALVVELQNNTTGLVTLFGWMANYTLSERTSK